MADESKEEGHGDDIKGKRSDSQIDANVSEERGSVQKEDGDCGVGEGRDGCEESTPRSSGREIGGKRRRGSDERYSSFLFFCGI